MAKEYDTSIREGESIEHYYKRLAKVADQRLVRLEQLAEQDDFEGVTGYAYRRAQKALDVWGGNRFNTKMPDSPNLRNEKIADMIHFIESKTSTKGGIVSTYKARAKTMKEKYGIDMTWQQMGKVMEAYSDTDSPGSPTKVKAMGIINQIDKEGIEATMKKNQNLSDDMVVEMAKKILTDPKFRKVVKEMKLKRGHKSSILQALEEIES